MGTQEELEYVQSAKAVRERCRKLYELACRGQLRHFHVHLERLDQTCRYVSDVIQDEYPGLEIPYHSRWRHFEAGGEPRLEALRQAVGSGAQASRAATELTIVSVLLDAGAGMSWRYQDSATGHTYSRSEGLAVATLDMFVAGLFSSVPERPCQVDAGGLRRLTRETLARGFQVTPDNPIVGLDGRLQLLHRLGDVVATWTTAAPDTTEPSRLGTVFDLISSQATDGTIQATDILKVILNQLGSIWPGRLHLYGVSLGDVWKHPELAGETIAPQLVPFHKLSQWLTYSLIEPCQWGGLTVGALDGLTGLPEYRNGGLLLDMDLLSLKDRMDLERTHPPSSTIIVEWRALTVSLLDEIAGGVRKILGLTEDDLPLAKVLQGGTWTAGRRLAASKRADGGPPLKLISDGTVF